MKRLFLFFLMLSVASGLLARPVDVNTARRVGATFLTGVGYPVNAAQLKRVETPFTGFYVFNVDSDGFVLVASDDCARPILGYSLVNRFPVGPLPTNLQGWLEDYDQEIAWIKQVEQSDKRQTGQREETRAVANEWHRLAASTPLEPRLQTVVAPLIATTWNQSPLYNDQCPYDDDYEQRVVTGCVATATAQIMKYWNYPATGYGSHSYTASNEHTSYGTLSADFGATTYEWTAMPVALTSASSQEEIDAVAQLMYHIGVAVEMNYDVSANGGSGAYNHNGSSPSAQNALNTYFKYSPDIIIINRNGYDPAAYCAVLRAELDQNRPILYNGYDNSGGHSFVCDGYDEYGNFHFNWGWGGSCDGFYAMGALNPTSGGSGSNPTHTYNINNTAMLGIRPNASFGTGGTVSVATSGGNSSCSVAGAGTYNFGETVSLSATAGEGYRFAGWNDGSQENPRSFIMNGGNYSYTAYFETIGSDTMSYCGTMAMTSYWGEYEEGFEKYWGIKLPAATLTAGRTLSAVDFYVGDYYNNGQFDVTVYSGTTSPTDVVYNTSLWVSSADAGSWLTVPLSTPYNVESGKNIWITFHNSDITFPATITNSCGNPDGFLYGPEFNPDPDWTRFSFMIRGIFTDPGVVSQGDTLSYCDNRPQVTSYQASQWGIMIPAAELEGRNYLKSVKLFTVGSGSYFLRVYRGGTTAPGVLVHTQPAYIDNYGWNEIVLDGVVALNSTDNLWITFSCPDINWPAATCRYMGDPNSNWVTYDDVSWGHINDYWANNYSWMIKAVTSAAAPTMPAPTIIIKGERYVEVGTPANFVALHSAGAAVSWMFDGGTPLMASGDTVSVVWNQTGGYQVSATATNSNGDSTVYMYVVVVDCNRAVSDFSYHLGFDATDNKVCLVTDDANADGLGWESDRYTYYDGDASYAVYNYRNTMDGLVEVASDDWLMLPKMSTYADGGYTISWNKYFWSYDGDFEAHYGLYIDTTAGTDVDNYILVQEFSFGPDDYYWWQPETVNLNAYAGKTFRLAFRHYNGTGIYQLNIDNINIVDSIPFFREGDTISYCGFRNPNGNLGYNNGATYWGVRYDTSRLTRCDTLKSVRFFFASDGQYTLKLSQGGDNAPTTLLRTVDSNFSGQYGWREFVLTPALAVDTTQPLWITLSSPALYPAIYTRFSGDTNSDWISGNGVNWVHSAQYNYNISWMIKAVVAPRNPCSDIAGDTTAVACDSFTWPLDGITYTESGDSQYTIHNSHGCDSVVTLHLTVNYSQHSHTYVTHCGPYYWELTDRTYNQSGDKFHSETTAEGCAIRDTLTLTINQNSESDVTVEIAATDLPYSFAGQVFDEFGQFDVVLTNAVGCDSTIHLTLNQNSGIQNPKFEIQNLELFPNPTTGVVHLGFDGNVDQQHRVSQLATDHYPLTTISNSQFSILNSKVEVLDLVGRCVARFENTATIDLSSLPNGTYTLRITLPDGIALRKVVKR